MESIRIQNDDFHEHTKMQWCSLLEPAPFSDDPVAADRHASIDFNPITLQQAKSGQVDRPIRVFAEGVYDVFHHGHAEQLRQAKNAFPNVYLIVGVVSDASALKYKGGATLMREDERYEAVKHCRYVDEVYRDHPFFYPLEFLNQIKADLVAHDALPYPSAGEFDFFEKFRDADRFLETKRTEGISTTDVVNRILSNLDVYRLRNKLREAAPNSGGIID